MFNVWSTCAGCGACCHSQFLREAELTQKEKERFNKDSFECDNGKCSELTPTGCKHDSLTRPLVCRMYPFVYYNGEIAIDMTCPVAHTLLLDLHMEDDGDTAKMLRGLKKEIRRLERISDPVLDAMPSAFEPSNGHLIVIKEQAELRKAKKPR